MPLWLLLPSAVVKEECVVEKARCYAQEKEVVTRVPSHSVIANFQSWSCPDSCHPNQVGPVRALAMNANEVSTCGRVVQALATVLARSKQMREEGAARLNLVLTTPAAPQKILADRRDFSPRFCAASCFSLSWGMYDIAETTVI